MKIINDCDLLENTLTVNLTRLFQDPSCIKSLSVIINNEEQSFTPRGKTTVVQNRLVLPEHNSEVNQCQATQVQVHAKVSTNEIIAKPFKTAFSLDPKNCTKFDNLCSRINGPFISKECTFNEPENVDSSIKLIDDINIFYEELIVNVSDFVENIDCYSHFFIFLRVGSPVGTTYPANPLLKQETLLNSLQSYFNAREIKLL